MSSKRRHTRKRAGATPGFTGLLVLITLSALPARGQITSQNSDQHTIINARAAALGDSYVSEDHDVSAMYWNPATLSFLFQQSVVSSYSIEEINSTGTVMTENVAVPVPPIGAWSSGIGITVHHIGKLEKDNKIYGTDFMVLGADLGVARTLMRSLSLGVTVTVRNGRVGSLNTWALNSTVGMLYQPDPGISYGIAFQGAGDAIQYPYENETLPATVQKVTPQHSLQIGLTMRYPSDPEKLRVVTISIANQKIFGDKPLTYKGGVEWYPVGFLAMRIGYWIGPRSVAAKYGLGLRLPGVQLDYAISPSKLEPRFHQFTMAVVY